MNKYNEIKVKSTRVIVVCAGIFALAPPNTAKLMFFRVTGYLQIDVGSMDEHSTKSDEEYESLAMRDVMATSPTMSRKL
ncbi:hypothetical protein ZEAMMB73_Zm00001d040419 [Zea mays]|uniref:Uncharacterized protein n=1 Tax=Zea mays TaxID=4577 RepID=A0A1D6MQM4_MAIZE|nr:hypothetical protein ZEAMMB73_Zm00001d040419 [Zea mays]